MMGVVDALVECLETPGGCAVVPGLPSNQYQLTLITSIIGGFIAGYASRLQPEGDAHGQDPRVAGQDCSLVLPMDIFMMHAGLQSARRCKGPQKPLVKPVLQPGHMSWKFDGSSVAVSHLALIDVLALVMITSCAAAGIVRRKWIWLLLFSPLWGTLFISFGIGPIVTRTSDRLPVLVNTAAFLAAALVFRLSPLFQQSAIDTSILKRSAQERDDGD